MGGFTILWWVLPYIDLNQPQVHMCPPILNPSHLPPHPVPVGCPRALALSVHCPASCSKLDLVIYFTYGNARFSAILSNHPTLTFSHTVQKSVI